MSDAPLPEFSRPPVNEVVLSVQFEKLDQLRSIQISRLWFEELKQRFPTTEEQPTLEPEIERFGGVPRAGLRHFRLEQFDAPPVPRYWFISASGAELVQVQQDRFVCNWRKTDEGQSYPRFEQVREHFQKEFAVFAEFLRRNDLGEVQPNQAEVTYVNHIGRAGVWKDHGDVGLVARPWSGQHSDDFLPAAEIVATNVRYVFHEAGEPIGRLHVALTPGFRKADDEPILVLNLTARGAPIGEGMAGVFKFFDRGREWIVRGFTSFTTRRMHDEWGRTR
jgi:uncharacterized protein (TIGR04255 family)